MDRAVKELNALDYKISSEQNDGNENLWENRILASDRVWQTI